MLFDCLRGENKVKEYYKIGPVSPGTALSPTCPEKWLQMSTQGFYFS